MNEEILLYIYVVKTVSQTRYSYIGVSGERHTLLLNSWESLISCSSCRWLRGQWASFLLPGFATSTKVRLSMHVFLYMHMHIYMHHWFGQAPCTKPLYTYIIIQACVQLHIVFAQMYIWYMHKYIYIYICVSTYYYIYTHNIYLYNTSM